MKFGQTFQKQGKRTKGKERQHFSEWIDLACYTIAGADRKQRKSI